MEKFIQVFNSKTGGVMGSGWGWLAVDRESGSLSIERSYGQDSVYCEGKDPILTVDVWEHAYYL